MTQENTPATTPATTPAHLIALDANGLGQMDGGAFGKAIARQLQLIQEDIVNRPCDAAGKSLERSLKITIRFNPVAIIDPETRSIVLQQILAEPEVKGLLPPMRGSKHDLRIRGGRMAFNKDVPANFTQIPMDYGEGDD